MKFAGFFHRIRFKPIYLLWLVALILVVRVFRSFPLNDVWLTLRQLSLGDIVILAAINVLVFALFTSRWWLFLSALGQRIHFLSLFRYRLAGFSLSYFTPGPQFGGEPLQVFLTRERQNVPGTSAVAAITLDKMLELVVNYSFLILGILLTLKVGLGGGSVSFRVLPFAIGLLCVPVLYFVALWLGITPFGRLITYLPVHFLQKRRVAVVEAEVQIADFIRTKPAVILLAFGISIGAWGLMVFEFWMMTRLIGFPLSFFQVIAALTAARVAFLAPSPGGLGTLEASQVIALQALGFSPALGLSLSLIIRARDLCFGAAGMGFGAYYLRVNRRDSIPAETTEPVLAESLIQ